MPRILHIEDDTAIARSLQEGLRREGYDVTWRNTGASGIEFAAENTPHLIILDVRLPDGSGFDVCRRLRQRGLRIDEADCTYFVGWHLVRARPRSGLAGLKSEVFAYLQRRSTQAAEFFRMPTKRVVMLATEIDI